ncbi:MAG: RNA pseudouridine synthase [Lachnospiraceae bacterium]|nr:RNA pseudouridine synthase [Lachnospiraceae bacterium]
MSKTKILYEDNDLLVCHKPAGIATQTARIGQADMASEMENYLARNLPGSNRRDSLVRPHIHVVHRLDQPVEGILVFAKQAQAAAALSAQAAGEGMEKEYLALACDLRGEGERKQSGILTDYLIKDGKTNISHAVPSEVKGAKEARLRYDILREEFPEVLFPHKKDGDGFSLEDRTEKGRLRCEVIKIRLYTGRHHQIRVQLANAGMPLLGDRKYADHAAVVLSENLGIREIALCAYRLSFCHPRTGERLHFEIMPEGAAFRGISF